MNNFLLTEVNYGTLVPAEPDKITQVQLIYFGMCKMKFSGNNDENFLKNLLQIGEHGIG